MKITITFMKSLRGDLNPQPIAYEAIALPLSHEGLELT